MALPYQTFPLYSRTAADFCQAFEQQYTKNNMKISVMLSRSKSQHIRILDLF